jgi:peptidyl-prolyl cis-trans isomerase D
MMMVRIVKNAKYIIFSFGILLVLGLVLMGPVSNRNARMATQVGVVNGVPISLEGFRQELNNFQEQQKATSGKAPEGLQMVQMRKQLFDFNVNTIILSQLKKDYELYASGEEMWDYLEKNPDPVIKNDTLFQTNGQFDKTKYMDWLHQERTLDIPFIQYLENRMQNAIIPEMQLKHLSQSQFHNTYLELAYEQFQRQSKAELYFYKVSLDSFKVEKETITDEEIKAYFEAHPDSFYSEKESAVLGYVQLEIAPSSQDSAVALDIIKDLKSRVEVDSNFEDLAVSYSDDLGSADSGGSLGGYQTRETWVPEFADVAFSLDSGEISDPVLTQFGYHLIKCNGVKEEDSVQKVDVSHILIKIDPTPETVDSLASHLENLKDSAKGEKSLEDLVEEFGMNYKLTPLFFKWNFAPLGEYDYISGLHSFAFGPADKKETVSEVLQNDRGVYLFEKKEFYKPGRSIEQAREKILEKLVVQKKLELAKAELEKHLVAIKSEEMSPFLGKAVLDSTDMVSTLSWIPGFGYNSNAINRVFTQEQGKWGEIHTTDYGAVIAKVVRQEPADMEKLLEQAEKRNRMDVNTYEIEKLHSSWFQDLVKSSDVENNLDLIYRN